MRPGERRAEDTRYVYGAGCTWNGPVQRVARNEVGLPCCPQCRGMLLEMPHQQIWLKGIKDHELLGATNYGKFMEWLRGKCYPYSPVEGVERRDMHARAQAAFRRAAADFTVETGLPVVLDPRPGEREI